MSFKSRVGKILKALGLFNIILTIVDVFSLAGGYLYYLVKRDTPAWAYQSFVRLFCVTRGYSNDFFSFIISKLHPPLALKQGKGLLPFSEGAQLKQAVADINRQGYVKYPGLVSPEVCEALKQIALKEPAWVRPIDVGTNASADNTIHAVYDSNNPIGIRYDMFVDQLIKYPLIQKIVTDPSILNLAQSYLQAPPVLDAVNMWWCTSYSKQASSEAAQKYHFDLERPKWLKIFVYLTDIDEETGPHCFVAKTHKSNRIPWKMLKKGYARIEDSEVAEAFAEKDVLVMVGPKGTLLAEDTRGLHKGLHLQRGERLIFQIQYSNSLFATTATRVPLERQEATPDFMAAMEQYPRVFQRFVVSE